jgi:hypothetical protein
VIRRHVLRNSLLPTIAVVATQVGYLIGGLVAIELIFNYNGSDSSSSGRRSERLPAAPERHPRRRSRIPRGDSSPTSSLGLNPRIRLASSEP